MLTHLKLRILVDNTALLGGPYHAEHGWSCLIETPGGTVLFDTGQSGRVLAHNLDRQRLKLDGLAAIVLSHGHYDHTGGLAEVLAVARHEPVPVFGHPELFEDKFSMRAGRARPVGVPFNRSELAPHASFRLMRGSVEVIPGLMTTGEIPRRRVFEPADAAFVIRHEVEPGTDRGVDPEVLGYRYDPDLLNDDLALLCMTPAGLVVVTGCAHAGLVNTLDRALELVPDQPVRAVIGGTHLAAASRDRLEATTAALDAFGPMEYWLGHCTGFDAACRMRERFGARVHIAAAGAVLEF